MPLKDSYNRSINYLRLSLLDACNFRCKYCLPENNVSLLKQKEWLTSSEISFLVETLADLGINKVRLTGGEPTIRKDFLEISRNIKNSNKIEFLHLTTNASWNNKNTTKEISEIFDGVNISLDSLNKETFEEITKTNKFTQVFNNIFDLYALRTPIKINMVVMKDINESEIIDFIELTKQFNIEVRFLESMPFDGKNKSKSDYFVSYTTILKTVSDSYQDKIIKLKTIESSTSEVYKIDGYAGKWSIIPAYSRTFCNSCNRIRITSTGDLINCLYQNEGLNIKNLIRNGISETNLKFELNKWVKHKPKDGFESEKNNNFSISNSMSVIGG